LDFVHELEDLLMVERTLAGQIALITGASSGIGRAIAEELAKHGADVALLARRKDELEETAQICASYEVRSLILPCDLQNRNELQGAVEQCAADLGGINILINNAGIMHGGATHELDLDQFDQVMGVNIAAPVAITRYALPHILKHPRGAVIQIASVAGKMSFKGGAMYCASKHALVGFSNSLFEDVREQGIKVCAICPGYVNTPMMDGRTLQLDKMIQPEDIAKAVMFAVRYPDTGCPTEIYLRPQRSPSLSR
tara:strand:- start:749 stop:1510 length:762 start_codon:yes stop_codon:yes gene_type:complete